MVQAMQKHYKISNINLSYNNFTSFGMYRFFESLHKNSTLEILNLDGNKFDGKAFETIIGMLWENLTLRILSLNKCELSPEGGDSLGLGLVRNHTL